MAAKNRSWTALMMVAVLSRLVAINGGPAPSLHLNSRPSKFSQYAVHYSLEMSLYPVGGLMGIPRECEVLL